MDSQQIVDTLKLALMIGDVRLTEEKEGVAGDIYVLDAAILGPSMLTKLSATTIKKFMICVQVCKHSFVFYYFSRINFSSNGWIRATNIEIKQKCGRDSRPDGSFIGKVKTPLKWDGVVCRKKRLKIEDGSAYFEIIYGLHN